MNKFIAVLQILLGAVLALAGAATLVNLLFIATRPETISVVNAMIGQGLLIIFLAAASRIVIRRGLARLRKPESGVGSPPAESARRAESGRNEA